MDRTAGIGLDGRGVIDWLRRTAPIWIAGLTASIIFAIPMWPGSTQYDLVAHIQYAKTIHKFSDITSPHFLFQLLLIAGHRITHISFEAGATVLMSASYASMAALIVLRMKKLNPLAAPALLGWAAVLVLIASHIFLLTAFKQNFYFGYIAPVVYHNPTQVLCKALAIPIMFAYFSMAFKHDKAWWWRVLLPIAVILSAVAKPSFLIAFLPCVCATELYQFCTGSRQAALRNFALIVLPACMVLMLQFRMTYTDGDTGLGWAPFLVYGGAGEVFMKLPGSLFFSGGHCVYHLAGTSSD